MRASPDVGILLNGVRREPDRVHGPVGRQDHGVISRHHAGFDQPLDVLVMRLDAVELSIGVDHGPAGKRDDDGVVRVKALRRQVRRRGF
jgi:hypothetical protein